MFSFLERQPKFVNFLLSLLLLALIGWADVVTGYERSLVLFYCIPVLFAGRLCERYTAFFIAALACPIWAWADFVSGHEYFNGSTQAWEITVRGAFFFAVAVAVVAVRDRQAQTDAKLAVLERARKLEHQVTEITEHEQQRVGKELHNGLSQYLAALSCAMSSLKMDTEKTGSGALVAKAGEIERLLSESVKQARDLARNLAPVQHSGPGLAAALEELTSATTRRMGIECSFESAGEEAIRNDGLATYLYRIAQEAIDNAVEHGKASSISVQLSANPSAISLTVSDDGVGFSKSSKNADGVGISVMEYRAAIIGGQISVEEPASGGTTVACVVLAQGEEKA